MRTDSLKLFKVTLRGMQYHAGTNIIYGVAYVVSASADEAYRQMRDRLEERKLGFSRERTLEKIELIAEAVDHPDCGTILYI